MAAHGPYDLQIKLLMIGDSAVGKTSLLLRYANDTFSSTFITTIGIDFKIKTINLDGKRGIVLVYDITDRGTLNSVRSWMAQINEHADGQVNKILVGNKCDNSSARKVSADEGRKLADEYGVRFIETSAKQNVNVTEAFRAIAQQVTSRIPSHAAGGVKLQSAAKPGGKKGCC
ncbi:GTPase [Aureococcus anophagefferens]|nr:GTPase [Aureococcus anophagefferens]